LRNGPLEGVCNFAKCPFTRARTHTHTNTQARAHTHTNTPFIPILENNTLLGVLHEVRKERRQKQWLLNVGLMDIAPFSPLNSRHDPAWRHMH